VCASCTSAVRCGTTPREVFAIKPGVRISLRPFNASLPRRGALRPAFLVRVKENISLQGTWEASLSAMAAGHASVVRSIVMSATWWCKCCVVQKGWEGRRAGRAERRVANGGKERVASRLQLNDRKTCKEAIFPMPCDLVLQYFIIRLSGSFSW